jgi:hypothetical protein
MSVATPGWSTVLELAPDRSVAAGSKDALVDAIRRGADLRIYTEFLYEEHIQPGGGGPALGGPIREVIDFRETLLIDDRYVAGITTLRQPLEPPHGFNGRDPKMSFFMYSMDGEQALANLVLGDIEGAAAPGERLVVPSPADMPKMSEQEFFDVGTSGPSRNFVYDMETFRFIVRDEWREVLAHDADGRVTAGSFASLEDAQVAGLEIKVGISDLGADLAADGPGDGSPTSGNGRLASETFTLLGSGFVHVRAGLYVTLTHPLVRITAEVPIRYRSGNWDVAWVFLRTDGQSQVRRIEPYTRTWQDRPARFACRWFVR